MGMREELESIRKNALLVSEVKETIQDRLADLSDDSFQQGYAQALPKRTHRASDSVSRNVMTKEVLEGLYAELEESERLLAGRAKACRDRLEAVLVNNPREMIVIDLYYLRGMSWEAVADFIGKSRATCVRLRLRAMDSIKEAEVAHARSVGPGDETSALHKRLQRH